MDSSTYVYDEDIRPIDHIEFNILGNEEIKRISCIGKNSIGIDIPDLYDNMEPKKGGLIDTRMGTTDSNIDCATCALNSTDCVGHFGHINLAEAAFHMGYINFIKKILSVICLKCSKLLIHRNEDELIEMLKNKSGKTRFAEIRNITKNVTYCQKLNYGCGTPVSKIKLEIKKSTGVINIISETNLTNITTEEGGFEGKKKIRQILTPEICYDIMKNISDTDCLILGIDPQKSRPEMMIHKVFPVPPVAVRPSAKADFMASSTMEDDLTHKLADIIKSNVRIRKYKESINEASAKYSQDHMHLLQYHIATYYDNDTLLIPRAEQRDADSKRVDYSARTVITPDAGIEINQLGIPLKVAMNLTFPEVVTPQNIDRLQKLVKNGRDKYPGANFVFQVSRFELGKRILPIDLRYRKEKVDLRYGDIVERHIVDDDYVLLNRQPTLHKLSMMGHRIKVIHNDDLSTFRLNVYVTTPYNADFDGDEMNIFVPQSIQAYIELSEIADVKRQIISPRTSAPIIGAVQDGLLGVYNLTAPNMRIEWKDAMNIISYTSIDDFSVFKKDKEYKGSELFSLIIPANIHSNRAGAVIEDGVIKEGQLKKAHLKGAENSLIHLIWDEYGIEETKNFLDNTARIVNNFNLYNGFTVGIGDIDISDKLEDEMNLLFENKKLEVDHLITDMENNPDLLDPETFENSINADLNAIRENVSKLIVNNLKDNNNFFIMLKSGSKGGEVNMGQMGGCIGQQAVEGKRIKKKVNSRSLPYFFQNDDSAFARGFVASPFMRGAHPIEFIFHNMASREGLIDTAIKTAESGYIQRKLIKSMEDAMIKYDGTVRNANKTILQFIYGDDGVDSTKQYAHNLNILKMGNKELEKNYKFTSNELGNYSKYSTKDNQSVYDEMLYLRDLLRRSQIRLAFLNYSTLEIRYMLPVNMNRVIDNVKNSNISGGKLEPDYVLKRINDILEYENTKVVCMTSKNIKDKNSLKYRDEMLCKTAFRLALLQFIGPKEATIGLKLNKAKFDKICDIIIKNFNKHIVEAGEMIGTIAAQSIGEPVTQMTLNSVDWEEQIMIKDNGKTKVIKIGEYIDNFIEENRKLVQKIGNNFNDEMGDIYYVDTSSTNIFTISVNEDGYVTWEKVNALTKHLPINKDGSNELVKIKTRMGKTVTATKAKSFLTRINNKIVPIRGDQIKVGTMMPIMMKYPKYDKTIEYIELDNYFPKSEYIYGSEIEKARIFRDQFIKKNKSKYHWFNYGLQNRKFIVPYTQYNSLSDVIDDKIRKQEYKVGYVYQKNSSSFVSSIPEKLKLDKLFGFFMGAYLAEGCNTKTYISISNNEHKFIKYITDFCDLHNFGYHLQKQENKIKDKLMSTDVIINSVLLTKLMVKLCDTESDKKHVPSWVFDANDEFVSGLLNGYFSGDGTVNVPISYIKVYSISERLIDDISLLLTRFNILSKKNKSSKYFKQYWTLSIRNDNIHIFNEYIGSIIDEKQEKLDEIKKINFKNANGIYDFIPGNNLNTIKGKIHRSIIEKLANDDNNEIDKNILKKILDSDVYYDEIISIELVKPSKKYVYDLTVKNTKNFGLHNGLMVRDTFHHAGIGAMGTSALGVPRMKELLSFSKNMKTPIMKVYLQEGFRDNSSMANKIASYIKYTTIKDIRDRVDIYYDPMPRSKDGFMEKDNVFNPWYNYNHSKFSCQTDIDSLPWLMRIELNKEKMMNKDITLLDLKAKFCNHWEKRYKDARGVKKEEKQLLERITQCSILTNHENARVPIVHIRFDMSNFDFSTIIGFLDVFIDNFKLKGLEGIDNIIMIDQQKIINFNNEDREMRSEDQNVVFTKGTNLVDIRYINGIDLSKTITNDVVDIYHKFGIEAARATLVKEIKLVFEGAGNFVNYQHLTVLIDIMTNNGTLTSIDRHGLNRLETDPLARASFEKTVDQLLTSAVFGEIDHMNSVSSRIMAGLVINGGTGLCNVILNSDLLENSEYVEDIEHKYKKTFTELSKNALIDDVISKDTSGMFIPAF